MDVWAKPRLIDAVRKRTLLPRELKANAPIHVVRQRELLAELLRLLRRLRQAEGRWMRNKSVGQPMLDIRSIMSEHKQYERA